MKTRDVVLGLIVLIVLIAGVLLVRKSRLDKQQMLDNSSMTTTEEKISNSFNGLEIPEDTQKIELTDVSGEGGFGIATENMVLVDLPDPEVGEFYQVWKEVDGKLVSLGKMRIAKGGYLLEANITGKVVVSREKVYDNTLETRLLEGSL